MPHSAKALRLEDIRDALFNVFIFQITFEHMIAKHLHFR